MKKAIKDAITVAWRDTGPMHMKPLTREVCTRRICPKHLLDGWPLYVINRPFCMLLDIGCRSSPPRSNGYLRKIASNHMAHLCMYMCDSATKVGACAGILIIPI